MNIKYLQKLSTTMTPVTQRSDQLHGPHYQVGRGTKSVDYTRLV